MGTVAARAWPHNPAARSSGSSRIWGSIVYGAGLAAAPDAASVAYADAMSITRDWYCPSTTPLLGGPPWPSSVRAARRGASWTWGWWPFSPLSEVSLPWRGSSASGSVWAGAATGSGRGACSRVARRASSFEPGAESCEASSSWEPCRSAPPRGVHRQRLVGETRPTRCRAPPRRNRARTLEQWRNAGTWLVKVDARGSRL